MFLHASVFARVLQSNLEAVYRILGIQGFEGWELVLLMIGNDDETSSYCMHETPLAVQENALVGFNGTRLLLMGKCFL